MLQRGKRDTVITTVLLLEIEDLELKKQYLGSIDRGPARIDEALVLSLYAAGNAKTRLAIARSVVVSRMRPRAFRKVFDPVYARPELSVQQRRQLMWNLEHFLILNPRQGPAYEHIILALARSPHLDLSVRGIPMAARFARLDAAMLALLARQLKSRSSDIRLTTINGYRHMVDRLDALAPDIRDLLSSDAFRETVARMHQSDPDEFVRKGTWFLLKKLRETFGPAKRRAVRPK